MSPTPGRPTRVIACFGGMVVVSGMERMSFEVLRVLREHGAEVHCIVNSWQNHRIVELAASVGATWSTGRYRRRLERTRNPLRMLSMAWDVLITSAGLLRDAIRFRPTHVLLPEHAAVLRNAPALVVLRALGLRVIVRLATGPEQGRFYERLWRSVLPPLATRFVHNSRFSYGRAARYGMPESKMALVRNRLQRRPGAPGALDEETSGLLRSSRALLVVGQIAPFKGTHLAVDAVIELLEERRDVRLVVVGRRPEWPPEYVAYYEAMEARASESGFSERVHFLGEREDVLEIMRRSYLLLAPILQDETFGNVLLEARAVGLPVVAFANGGIPELVEHGQTGFLCEEATLRGLLEGARHYLDHPHEREEASERSLESVDEPGFECAPAKFDQGWLELFGMGSPDARSAGPAPVASDRLTG